MINKIQLHLETIYKEYLETKNFILKFKEDFSKLKEEVAKESLEMDEDKVDENYYKRVAWVGALESDLIQLKVRLYHTWIAYKDIAELSKELKEEIEEELKDLNFKVTYDVKGSQVTLIDKDAYEYYKKQFMEIREYQKSQLNGKSNT